MVPDETTYKIVSLPRYQRQWLREHKSINTSGLLQEIIIQVIKERDPDYYRKYQKYIEKEIRRSETTPKLKDIPLYQNNFNI